MQLSLLAGTFETRISHSFILLSETSYQGEEHASLIFFNARHHSDTQSCE